MKKRILIIAPNDKHLLGFITHLNEIKKENYNIDHFALAYKENNYPFNKTFHIKKHFPKLFYHKALIDIVRYVDLYLSFKKIKSNYDLVNVHFVSIDSFVILSLIKRKTNKLMLTPWGSDALRVNNFIIINFLKKLYASADYVTLANIRFRHDVVKRFEIEPNKLVDLSYGATMIDYIAENPIPTLEAKMKLGLNESFIITAGYNRSPLQNHESILQSIIKNKEKLPKNLVVLFPFTYNGSVEPYKSRLIEIMEKHQIQYLFFEKFLEEKSLRDIIFATDIFINVQETDANSASLQEYILAGKIVINGSWLKYDQLERLTKPYYLANDKNHISNALQEVIDNNFESKVKPYHLEEIKKFGWKQKALDWNMFYSEFK